MTMSRRQFFKLAAAGAAVAFVPTVVQHAVSAIAPTPTPTQVPVGIGCWRIQTIEHRCTAGGFGEARFVLYRGSWRVDITLAVTGDWPDFDVYDELELDIALDANRRPMIVADGATLQGVSSLMVDREQPLIEVTSLFGDTARQFAPFRPRDDDGLDDLTISKQLRERKR